MIRDKLLKEWLSTRLQKGSSPLTVKQYYYRIQLFLKFLNSKGKTINNLTDNDLREFIECTHSEYEQKMRKFAIKDFLEFISIKYDNLNNIRKILENAKLSKYSALRWSSVSERKKAKYALTIDEIVKILEITIDHVGTNSLIQILIWTGARPYEITVHLKQALKKENKQYIDWDSHRICIETAKRSDPDSLRVIPFPEELEYPLKVWCRFIENKNNDRLHEVPYFMLKRLESEFKTKIGKTVTPVTFRRTVETLLQANGVPIPVISLFLGHKLKDEIIRALLVERGIEEVYLDKELICEQVLRPELKRKHFYFEVLEKLEI